MTTLTTTPRRISLRLKHGLLLAASCTAHPAFAETSIRPFVEARQVLTSNDLLALDDYRSWLELAGGFQADFDSQRVDGSLDYRISRRVPVNTNVSDRVRHRGSGSVRAEVLRDYLYLNAQGSASIVSPTLGGLINPDSDDPSDQQTFTASIQPSFNHTFANRIRVTGDYRYSLVEVDGRYPALKIGGPFLLDRPFFGGASDQRSQSASASIGNVRRSDRIRVQLSGNYQRDRIEQLNEHYDEKSVVADGELALTRFISLVGSGGYEDIRNELDGVLLDQFTGLPILDAAGRLQADPANPRRVNFDFEGPRWDAGFRLTPSRRTGLLVRLGRRYGSFSGSGSFYYRARSDLTLTAGYQDSINNFGRLYTTLYVDPASGAVIPIGTVGRGGGFRSNIPLGAGSCAYGFDPDTQFCRFNLSQIATSAVFRNRTASLGLQKGSEDFANNARFFGLVSAFYTKRRYLGESDVLPPPQLPFNPALYLAGTTDKIYGVAASAQRLLGGNRYATFDIQAVRNEYALSGISKDFYVVANSRYEMLINKQINLFATAFLSRRFVNLNEDTAPELRRYARQDRVQATFSVGVRYLFGGYRGRFTPAENVRQ